MFYTLKSDSNSSKYGELVTYTYEQKKSKFISYIFNTSSENDARACITKIVEDNKDARHIVYIYSYLNENKLPQIRYSDDGEPQGTGTKAIYELITKEKITNICVVIVRFFGGILLGAGPLSRAYLNSFRGALEHTNKEVVYNYLTRNITIEYNTFDILMSKLSSFITERTVVLDNVKYTDRINISLSIEENSKDVINKVIDENLI